MAAWGYEFHLHVLKVSLTSERYFQHWKIKFVSPRGHVISSTSLTSVNYHAMVFSTWKNLSPWMLTHNFPE